jgi:phosphatidylglycerophosphate synthase
VGIAPAVLAATLVLARARVLTTVADRVTLTRTVLACGCAAMAVLVLLGAAPAPNGWLFGMSIPTLLLDAVDGYVARRTDCATDEGARLDMEIDAALLVALSAAVATEIGWWAFFIGAMRYLYIGASRAWPTLATAIPRSRFRVVVAGSQGAVLSGALAPFIPSAVATVAVAMALALLLASFGSQVVEVERTRGAFRSPTGGD